MNLRWTITLFACLGTVFCARGQIRDSADVIRRMEESLCPVSRFAGAVYDNPAARPWARERSLTTLGLSADYGRQTRGVVMQQGEGERLGGFEADSYLHTGERNTLWGGAGYHFGRSLNVQWNETADFGLLYPYVTADSVGGDLSRERYTFSGGFARESGRVSWGIQAGFRAEMQVRRTDPRPRNVVSDLNLSGGTTFALGARYRLGAALHGRIYKQQNSLAFYDPRGTPKVYLMTGLGMYSTRFSNGQTLIHYRGGSYGASVELFAPDKKGLSAMVAYERFTLRRILDEANKLPVNRLDEDRLRGELAWQGGRERWLWGLKLAGEYSRRSGTEFIYGESGGTSNYPKIGEMKPYRSERNSLLLSGLWGRQGTRSSFYLEPWAGFYAFRESYADPYRLMSFTKPGGGLTLTGTQSWGRSFFQLALSADLFTASGAEAILSGLDPSTALGSAVQEQFRRLSSGYGLYGLAVQWNYRAAQRLALYLRAACQQADYRNGIRSRMAALSCGIGF